MNKSRITKAHFLLALRTPYLRAVVFLAIGVMIVFPLYAKAWLFPQFRALYIKFIEFEASRTVTHVSSYDLPVGVPLTDALVSPELIQELHKIRRDFQLYKLRIFSPDGLIIYSSKTEEKGDKNNHRYFYQQVAKGEVFSKFVVKEAKSSEGEIVSRDVIEVYVPVMHEGRFMGALEVYYDITVAHQYLVQLLNRSFVVILILVGGFFLVLLMTVLHAGKLLFGQQKTRWKLKESEARFRSLTMHAQDGIIELDQAMRIQYWNLAAKRIFGFDEQEAVGRKIYDLIVAKDLRDALALEWKEFVKSGARLWREQVVELTGVRRSAESFPLELSIGTVHSAGKWRAVGIMRDITQRKIMDKQLLLGGTVFEYALEGIVVMDKHRHIEMVNPAFLLMTGFSKSELIGKTGAVLHSDRHSQAFYESIDEVLQEKGRWQGEVWHRHKNGTHYLEEMSVSAVKDANDKVVNYVRIGSDITQRKKFESQLEKMAFYDPLTGVANRMLFHDRLHQELVLAKRRDYRLAIFYLDLDFFKQVNDTYGHAVGDSLLRAVAERLTNLLREEDTVARLGGDEFSLIQRMLHRPREDATLVANRIIGEMTRPFNLAGTVCKIGVSIGIALFPEHGQQDEALIKMADTAMYQAKKGGRNGFVFADQRVGAG
ncbi:diguanylate cyclase domain-containing protein [Magnetococcales bacterium HHB-1]